VKKFVIPALAGIFERIRQVCFGGNHKNRLKAGLQTDSEAPHLKTGRIGEKQAETFLKKAGLKIIARNVHVGYDELDLIARQGDTLVFVEVKTRKNEDFGRPAAAVNRAKRKKLSRAAMHFLKKRKLRPPYIRFDVVEVIGDKPDIRHIQNAFQLEGGYRIWW
jgi:putative endonuclease